MQLPPVIYGTSCLGNLYQATSYENKLAIVKACIDNAPNGIAVFDTAGKYGAGLALEMLGKCLSDLKVDPSKVLISNKLGWIQTELTTPEPTFEKGVWFNLKNDAVQTISYQGIIDCFEQGNALLGGIYQTQFASVHDPDEYLAAAVNAADADKRFQDIVEAYQALQHLKDAGKVQAIGIGAKNWQIIFRIAQVVKLDWIMFANSLTIHAHPQELVSFVADCAAKGIVIINSAVFNGGFLTGSDYYNYSLVNKETLEGKALYAWRDAFYEVCNQFDVLPAEACFNYAFQFSGIQSIALNTSKPEKVAINVAMATKKIPDAFWQMMQSRGLLN
jgi:D-threo-aldose 1-dehydrogenase